jgi:hypothetical protein
MCLKIRCEHNSSKEAVRIILAAKIVKGRFEHSLRVRFWRECRSSMIKNVQFVTLRNSEGFVEVEPYAVVGGHVGVRMWERQRHSSEPMVMMPLPTSPEEADHLTIEGVKWNIPILDESAFASRNACWIVSGLWLLDE